MKKKVLMTAFSLVILALLIPGQVLAHNTWISSAVTLNCEFTPEGKARLHGYVTVNNLENNHATQDLSIKVILTKPDASTLEMDLVISPADSVLPGSSKDFPFEFLLDPPIDTGIYVVSAIVTISNLSTHWWYQEKYGGVPPSESDECFLSGICVRTQGYWKTHSIYGPAPYDDTWAEIGEDTTFFLSGKSYYEVLWTQPAGGNAYYILAHQYIAAELNMLAGADGSLIEDEFDEATELFETYTPEQIGALKGNDPIRQRFLELAGILEDFNEGRLGPGHCE